jgi:hypothetical protein
MYCKNAIRFFSRIGMLTAIVAAMISNSYAEQQDIQVEQQTGFYYTIHKGDTLWDISERFSDDAWLWPELWKENDQIPNPHWIYPGERIRLYQGLGSDTVHLNHPESAMLSASATTPGKSESANLKKSFFYCAQIDQIGFIRKEPLTASGVIFKVQSDKVMISSGDMVYIDPPTNQAAGYIPGSKYTIYRTMRPSNDKKSEAKYGTQYYLLGTLEIIKNEDNYAIARVLDSFRNIKVNDQLMPYVQHPPEISIQMSPEGIEGRIITSEEHGVIMGEHSIAFIDKGEVDQIVPGQRYGIYYQPSKSPNRRKGIEYLAPIDIGSLVVLRTEKNTSTVLITDSAQNISAGEKFHTLNN